MQHFFLIVNWSVALALLALGFLALLKNYRLLLNRTFAFFTVCVSIWIVASYISNDVVNSPKTSVIGNYLVFMFSYFSAYLLLWFSVALTNSVRVARYIRIGLIPIIAVGLTTATPLVVAGAHRQGTVYAVEFGPLIGLYFVCLLLFLAAAMVILHRGIKRSSGHKRAHLVVLYSSMIIALPILLITEFILPALTGWFGLTNIGIVVMAVPSVGLYYGVVRLRLFNLRWVIVRSFAYICSIIVIASIYGFAWYYITREIVHANSLIWQEVVNVTFIILTILLYPSVIALFRRISNRLFYRDVYDPQELFDSLNKVLVSTLDVKQMLTLTSITLTKMMKIERCFFVLSKNTYSEQRIVGQADVAVPQEILVKIADYAKKTANNMIAIDMLEDEDEIKALLDAHNIAVFIVLSPAVKGTHRNLGYMAVGNKKSGSAFVAQDVRVLDTVANELVIAIQNALHFEEIQNFNETLKQKVDDATIKLRKSNARLKQLDESKDDFISMASHQLRTPLTSIKGYVSMVLDGDGGPVTPLQDTMLRQAFLSSQRMVSLVADLLNVSRLSTGKFIIERSSINLAKVVAEEVGLLREMIKGQDINLVYEEPENFPEVQLDDTKIRQVIMNFIDNALYYTKPGGTVWVGLDDSGDAITLRVVDTGIGVPKAEQHHLFTKFYRAGNARQVRPDGTGLGLYMAKKVIVAQEGSLIFESIEGKGSTFGFQFNKDTVMTPVIQAPATNKK